MQPSGTQLRRRRAQDDFARRLATSRRLVGYTSSDEALVHASRAALRPRAGAIARTLYAHLVAQPETAAPFTLPDGRLDRGHLDAREETMAAWLTAAIDAPPDAALAARLARIGQAHIRPERGARVAGRYLVIMMSFLQTAIIAELERDAADPSALPATAAAWNKLLMIHLDLLLAVYDAAEGSPHWY